ncbi:MAG: tyrosine-type recombinase/integrase family protein [Bifidobacterium sp.]|nr:tyrosine-type recombinase/integrase family protein [Bifidobacterium sp.]
MANGKRAARGTYSVNGMGGITKVYKTDKANKRYFAGYRAKFLNPITHKYVTQSFKAGQLEQARTWVKREVGEYQRCQELGIEYKTPKEREKLERVRDITVADYAMEYLDNYRNPNGEKLRPATLRNKRNHLRHIVDYFGSKRMRDVTTLDVREFVDWMGQYGAYARRNALRELRAIMRKAAMATDEAPALIPRNPTDGVPIPKVPDSKQAKIPTATPEELETLYDSMPDYTRIAIKLGAFCGLRIAEVCALQVRDVDFKRRLLYVRHSLERDENDRGAFHLGETKNEASNNSVNIPDSLIPLLRKHVKTFTDGQPDSMLISAEHGEIIAPNTIRKQFSKARVAAGRPDLHFHTLRATYDDAVSRVAENAADYMASTRRRDVNTGVEHYQRSKEDTRREITRSVDEALSVGRDGVLSERERLEQQLKELQARLDALEGDR